MGGKSRKCGGTSEVLIQSLKNGKYKVIIESEDPFKLLFGEKHNPITIEYHGR